LNHPQNILRCFTQILEARRFHFVNIRVNPRARAENRAYAQIIDFVAVISRAACYNYDRLVLLFRSLRYSRDGFAA
jgi:hypothetical protein